MAVAFGIPTLIVYPFDYSPWNARSPTHSLATMFYFPQARTLLRFINACQLFSLSSTLILRTSLLAAPGAAVCNPLTLSVDISRSVSASARCIPALLLVVLYVTYAVFPPSHTSQIRVSLYSSTPCRHRVPCFDSLNHCYPQTLMLHFVIYRN